MYVLYTSILIRKGGYIGLVLAHGVPHGGTPMYCAPVSIYPSQPSIPSTRQKIPYENIIKVTHKYFL